MPPALDDSTGLPPLVVAIDGPAGSGKSTLAKSLAQALHWAHLDSGAMYRAVTVEALDRGVALTDVAAIVALAKAAAIRLDPRTGRVRLNGRDVTQEIRTERVNAAVSVVAAIREVREVMVAHQRAFADWNGRIVAEGRDMGTVVFPQAVLKVYLDASPEVRAARRVEETKRLRPSEKAEGVEQAIARRDALDSGREVAPLRQAPGAVVLDSTTLTPAEVLARVLAEVNSRVPRHS
jgi:cytidylate kinase